MRIECPLCDGDGCDACQGTGEVEEGSLIDEVFKDDDALGDQPPVGDDCDSDDMIE